MSLITSVGNVGTSTIRVSPTESVTASSTTPQSFNVVVKHGSATVTYIIAAKVNVIVGLATNEMTISYVV